MVELVFNTAEQVDVTGWWPRNGAAWAQECTPESSHGRGDATANYSYDCWTPRGTDHIGDGEARRCVLGVPGHERAHRESDNTPDRLPEGGPVLRAVFDTAAADQSCSVGATAPCSPGDAFTLNEDSAERDQGKVLPGDEGLVLQDPPQ